MLGSNISLRTRLLSGYFLAACIFVVLEFYSFSTLHELKKAFLETWTQERYLRVSYQLDLLLRAQDELELRFLLTKKREYLDLYNQKSKEFLKQLEYLSAQGKKERALLRKMRKLYRTYLKKHKELVAGIEQGWSKSRSWRKSHQTRELMAQIMLLQDELIDLQDKNIVLRKEQIERLTLNAQRRIAIVTFLLIGLGALVSYTTAFSFRKRLKLLMEACKALEAGKPVDLDLEGKDEIARLARAFQLMEQKVKDREEKLKSISYRDPLTNLYNFRYLQKILREKEIAHRHKKEVFALFMLDLDNFKAVNDTYGHLEGDQVLKEVARILQNAVREEDTVCRYGGEEFAILTPQINQKEAKAIGERVRQEIKKKCKRYHLTVSIGLAFFPEEAQNVSELLSIADERLYQAKSLGKNKVLARST